MARMAHAAPFPNLFLSLYKLKRLGFCFRIISHRTKYPI